MAGPIWLQWYGIPNSKSTHVDTIPPLYSTSISLFFHVITYFPFSPQIFDAVIILASFALDLVFLEGIGGAQGEEAAALLIVFLLWRILRVINGELCFLFILLNDHG